jgi:hypothetical protein
MAVDLSKFEWIDWDPEDDERGNTAHCRRLGIPEQVVYEVLSEEPVEIKFAVGDRRSSLRGAQSSAERALDTVVRYVIQTR